MHRKRSNRPSPRWRVWVDTGGTFTDCLAVSPADDLLRAKVLSTSALRVPVGEAVRRRRAVLAAPLGLSSGPMPGWTARPVGSREPPVPLEAWDAAAGELLLEEERSWPAGVTLELRSPEEAPLLAARMVTGTSPRGALPPLELRLATTLGTNALLERRGAATALFVTRGFGDLLRIGDQRRPDLFALAIVKPEPLCRAAVEVSERRDAQGAVLEPLDLEALSHRVDELLAAGVSSAAVALLHAYRDSSHEESLAAFLRQRGFLHVSTSAALAPVQGYLPRAETAVVDAYLAPILEGYLGRIAQGLASDARVHLMTSAGGLVAARSFRPKDGLLSGPAGGVVGALAVGRRSGRQRLLTFDMGGTSTDVARCDGELPYVFEHRVGSARLLAPALAVETVAAGGGSVCWFDGQQVRVGPESGGALPGPASYGAGGPLCLTDVNLLLGRLDPGRFHIPLDLAAAHEAFEALRGEVARACGQEPDAEELLEGFRRIADERMADAIREISVRQGYDPAEYTLLAFGGAGPQHACAVAKLLGVGDVLVPADAGLLSAVGLGSAAVERFATREVLLPLAAVAAEVAPWLRDLGESACREVAEEGVPDEEVAVARNLAHLRFAGQEGTVEVDCTVRGDLEEAFRARYRELFGYLPEGAVELVSLRAVARSRPPELQRPSLSPSSRRPRKVSAQGRVRAWIGGGWQDLPVYRRAALLSGDRLLGPALVTEEHSTTWIEPGWRLEVDGALALRLEATSA